MSTLRFDPTTSDWVIFAPSRSLRPQDKLGANIPEMPMVAGLPILSRQRIAYTAGDLRGP
jgi:hypothetical protein